MVIIVVIIPIIVVIYGYIWLYDGVYIYIWLVVSTYPSEKSWSESQLGL